MRYASRPPSAASHIAVSSQARLRHFVRRSPRRLPSGPSSWRRVHRTAAVCSRPSTAGREAPLQPRTRRRSDAVAVQSRLAHAWFQVRRPTVRNRPEMTALVTFVPRELAVGVDRQRNDPRSVTPRARSRGMEEKRRNGLVATHGFLAQAMVRNPPCAGGSGQLYAL
jgi:hypothetical protein